MKKYRLYKIYKPTQILILASSGNSTKIISDLIAAHNAGDDVFAINPDGVKIRAREKRQPQEALLVFTPETLIENVIFRGSEKKAISLMLKHHQHGNRVHVIGYDGTRIRGRG